MEVILKQDITNLGYKDDIVKVKPGYARNYLVPQGQAIIADESSRKVLAETLKQRAFKESKIKKEAEALAESLKSCNLQIGAKVSTTGKIFGAVTSIQIAEMIKKQYGYDVDRKRINIKDESIKEVGKYAAEIKLHKEVSVTIDFEVIAE